MVHLLALHQFYSLDNVDQNCTSLIRFYFNFISKLRKLCRKNSGFVAVSKNNSGMVTLCIVLHPVLSLLHLAGTSTQSFLEWSRVITP